MDGEPQLFREYSGEELHKYQLVAPQEGYSHFYLGTSLIMSALFVRPKSGTDWCVSSLRDPSQSYFLSPSILRVGAEACANRDDFLSFVAAARHKAIGAATVRLFTDTRDNRWRYLGETVVGSGFGHGGFMVYFELDLEQKLPRDVWIEYGGYSGFLVCLGQQSVLINSKSDCKHELHEHWGITGQFVEITRYEGDALFAATDDNEVAVVTYQNGRESLHSGRSEAATPDTYSFGEFEFPRSWVVSRNDAIDLICRFVRTGTPVGLTPD